MQDFGEYFRGARVDIMLQVYKKHYQKKYEGDDMVRYTKEMKILVSSIRKELTLSGTQEHRDNVVAAQIDRFVKDYILVDVQLTVSEIEVLLSLLRSDGGPTNNTETNALLKLSFAVDAYILE